MKKGRPSQKLLNKYSYNLDDIKEYYNSNIIQEINIQQNEVSNNNDIKQGNINESITDEVKNDTEIINNNVNTNIDDGIDITEYIKIDEDTIIKADAVMSAIIEGGLNFVGVKKEVEVMNEKEAEFFIKIMPPLKLKKNWTNFFIAYLFLKIVK